MAQGGDLRRFILARNGQAGAGTIYERAMQELAAGGKQIHWMWFVFPQLAGLGKYFEGTVDPELMRLLGA